MLIKIIIICTQLHIRRGALSAAYGGVRVCHVLDAHHNDIQRVPNHGLGGWDGGRQSGCDVNEAETATKKGMMALEQESRHSSAEKVSTCSACGVCLHILRSETTT